MSTTPKVTGIQHVGIPTADLEKSVAFYRTLGFETIYSTPNGPQQFVTFMQLGNLVMEIYTEPSTPMLSGAIDHVAIDVAEGIDTLYSDLLSKGLTMCTDGVCSLPFWERGIRYFIVLGPNAERIEFCQRL